MVDWLDLLAVQGTLKSLLQQHSSKASILRCSTFFIVPHSHPYMTTGKTIALTRGTFVGKVMSLLFNMLSKLGILLDLSTMTSLSWVAWLSFIESDKAVVHVIRLASFLWLWFQSVCHLMPSLSAYHLTWVSVTLDVGYLFTAAPAKCSRCSLPWTRSPLLRYSFQFSSVAQLCPTLCDPMNHSTPCRISVFLNPMSFSGFSCFFSFYFLQ